MKRKKKLYKPLIETAPICPYCNKRAVLKDASFIYGEKNFLGNRKAWVCPDYKKGCDSYVLVDPTGKSRNYVLANRELREKRKAAHDQIKRLMAARNMGKPDAYHYLETHFGLKRDQLHMSCSSGYFCDEIINHITQLLGKEDNPPKIDENC